MLSTDARWLDRNAKDQRGFVDFTVPLFAEYTRENHPIGTFDEG
jgi:hypothetical protein